MPRVRYRCDRCDRRYSFVRVLSGHDAICENCGGTLQRSGAAHRIGPLMRRLPRWAKFTIAAVAIAVAVTVLWPHRCSFGTVADVSEWMHRQKLWQLSQQANPRVLRGRRLQTRQFAADANWPYICATVFFESNSQIVRGVIFQYNDWCSGPPPGRFSDPDVLIARIDCETQCRLAAARGDAGASRLQERVDASSTTRSAAGRFLNDHLAGLFGASLHEMRFAKDRTADISPLERWEAVEFLGGGIVESVLLRKAQIKQPNEQPDDIAVDLPVLPLERVWGDSWHVIFRDGSWQ